MLKKVLVFGSTGSIGKNALEVIRNSPKLFKVLGLCANDDINTIAAQAKEFRPGFVFIYNDKRVDELKKMLPKGVRLLSGPSGLDEFSSLKADISVMAISGISCLKPLYNTIANVKRVALANKEAVVAAGKFIFPKAKRCGTEIIPVDSEINSLFQLSCGKETFSKVYLTASGGALYDYTPAQLKKVTAAQVLAHPTWRMGKRITVDSATLVNKAFEVIETHRFFNIDYKNIDVLIHRQSYVHALVNYADGMIMSCMYPPDMKVPIAHALHYPSRAADKGSNGLDKNILLTFEPLPKGRFPGFDVVMEAAKKDANLPAIANACDEVAVDAFLRSSIRFMDIAKVIEGVLSRALRKELNSIDEVFFWDNWAREKAEEYLIRNF